LRNLQDLTENDVVKVYLDNEGKISKKPVFNKAERRSTGKSASGKTTFSLIKDWFLRNLTFIIQVNFHNIVLS